MQKFCAVIAHRNPLLNRGTLRMGTEMGEALGLQEGDKISLYAGRLSTPLKLCIGPQISGKNVNISLDVLKQLHLSASSKYGICKNNEGIHLGPVFGIMVDSSSDINRPFRDQSSFISHLIESGTAMGQICFAFSTDSVNFSRKIIYGYTYGKGGWKRGIFPIPDVVYPREAGYSKPKLRIRRKMQSLGCKFINPTIIGKWENHKILSQHPTLSSYLPETCLATSFHQVGRMLKKYGGVYLKPITGSRGRNIIRVLKRKNLNLYDYQYQASSQPRIGTSNGINGLRHRLERFMGKRGYIVQQQINLLRVDGNIVDVRILVQKDHTGHWLITGKACRIGSRGSITSNISSGGRACKVETVVSGHFSDPIQRERILTDIDYLALESAQALEANTSSMGELGIDIGIDKNGKLWFIEANLRPARRVFTLIGEPDIRLNSVERPLLYARYLAGFSQERQD
ncbi:MAG: YheC/YheD family protein [Syntrophomonas sp.]|nr:YheC/YheD family protein [Syntrophomonas sp.]